jgi:nicotinate-nucleotide adenylyltransferase
MQIILFGGAFDPPHVGHQQITQSLLDQQLADEVWYVPAKEHPFSKPMSSAAHRLAMLKLIIDNPKVKIETYELEKDGVSYSRDTLDHLSNQYPEHTFSWIIGSDNLPDFHKWEDSQGRGYQDLLANYKFYVYPRKDYPMKPLYDHMLPLENVKEVEASSTEAREKIKQNKEIKGLIDQAVISYISQHQLYKN